MVMGPCLVVQEAQEMQDLLQKMDKAMVCSRIIMIATLNPDLVAETIVRSLCPLICNSN